MTTAPKTPAAGTTPAVQSADELAEAAKAAEATAKTPAETPAATPETPAAQEQAPKPLTAQEYIEQAPPEIRDFMQSALKAQNDRKAAAIATIKANSKNKLSDATLAAMTVEDLENLVELSGAEVSYAGRSVPTPPTPTAQTAFVAAPKVFEAPKPGASAVAAA